MMKTHLHNIVFRAARKCVRLVFDTNSALWFEKDLDSCVPASGPEILVQVGHSTEETISWIQGYGERWMRNKKEFAVARKEHHIYPNMKHENRIIGYMKAGMGRVYIDDFKQVISFPPGCAFFYDIYVAREYRNKALAAFLAAHTMAYLKDKGFTRVRLHIPAWNTASLSVAHKLGFKQFAYTRVFRIFNCITLKVDQKNEKTA